MPLCYSWEVNRCVLRHPHFPSRRNYRRCHRWHRVVLFSLFFFSTCESCIIYTGNVRERMCELRIRFVCGTKNMDVSVREFTNHCHHKRSLSPETFFFLLSHCPPLYLLPCVNPQVHALCSKAPEWKWPERQTKKEYLTRKMNDSTLSLTWANATLGSARLVSLDLGIADFSINNGWKWKIIPSRERRLATEADLWNSRWHWKSESCYNHMILVNISEQNRVTKVVLPTLWQERVSLCKRYTFENIMIRNRFDFLK